jgi:hypothetical protein
MWEAQPLTTLRASKACRGENFTLLFFTFSEYAVCESDKEFYKLDVYVTQLSVSTRKLHEAIAPDI